VSKQPEHRRAIFYARELGDNSNLGSAYLQARELLDSAFAIMSEFKQRVKKGEVKSTRTYKTMAAWLENHNRQIG